MEVEIHTRRQQPEQRHRSRKGKVFFRERGADPPTCGVEDMEESVGQRGGLREGSHEPLKVLEQVSNIDQSIRGERRSK